MKTNYKILLKKVVQKEKLKSLTFLRGPKKYSSPFPFDKEGITKKRPYVILKGTKEETPVVLKALIRKNYLNFFRRELFVYTHLKKIIPHLKNSLPLLISFSYKPFPYMILKYYDNWHKLGKSFYAEKELDNKNLSKLLKLIDSIHINRHELFRTCKKLKINCPLKTIETWGFYWRRYQRETKGTLKRILKNNSLLEKLEKFFLSMKYRLKNHFLCWGDANPSNILYKKNLNGHLTFVFLDFEKIDISYSARDYTTLFYSFYLKNKNYGKRFLSLISKNASKTFWDEFYFKLLIYSLPRQYVNLQNNPILSSKIEQLLFEIADKV